MKLSFVIPSFNDFRILEAIKSIKQNVKNKDSFQVEIIVQDGGSNKELLLSINNLLGPDDKLVSEEDCGIFDGINRGIQNSNGDLIATIGSDDRVVHLDLKELFGKFNLGYNYFQFDIQYTDNNWNPIRYWKARSLSKYNLYIGRQYAHFGLITTKRIYEQSGYFNTLNLINADYEFFYTCIMRIRELNISPIVINSVFVQMKMGGNSSNGFRAILRGNLRLLKFIWHTDKKLMFGFLIKPLHKFQEILYQKILSV